MSIPLFFLFLIPIFQQYQYVFYKNRQFPADTESRQITFVDGSKNHSQENITINDFIL